MPPRRRHGTICFAARQDDHDQQPRPDGTSAVSHSAFVLAKSASGWRGEEIDVHDVADLDELADLMRDIADGGLAIFFLEEDDEYVALARVEGDDDPKGFISDVRSLEAETIGSTIFEGAL